MVRVLLVTGYKIQYLYSFVVQSSVKNAQIKCSNAICLVWSTALSNSLCYARPL